MESISDLLKPFEDRLLNLSDKVNNYNTSLEDRIGQVQERTLGDQSREEISQELSAFNSAFVEKFDEIHEKLKNKDIPEEEIIKFSKQIVQMAKTVQSFHNSLITTHSSLKLDLELKNKYHELERELETKFSQLIESFLKDYIKVSLVYSNNPKEIISQCSISTLQHVVRTYFPDFAKRKNVTAKLGDNYIFTLNPEDQEDKILLNLCEWLEKDKEGKGDEAFRLEIFPYIIHESREIKKNTALEEKAEAFAIDSFKDNFNPQTQTITGEKWLEYALLAKHLSLPGLKQTCIEFMPYLKVDLAKPEGMKCLFDIGLLKFSEFSEESYYPPVNLTTTEGDKIAVDFVKLLYFSSKFQNMMEFVDYTPPQNDLIKAFASSSQMNTLINWMDQRMKENGKREDGGSLITEGNWKELLQIANFWGVKELKDQCEEFAIHEINQDDYPKIKYTKEQLREMIKLAESTDSKRLLDALLGKWITS